MFQVGQTFGDFEILSCLGPGGASAMYKARQISMDRGVALKTLQGAPATTPEAVARFCRDAKIAGALNHPDLVHAYATGETDGVHWVAMEFIEGTTAQARLKRKGKLALTEAVAIGTHVAGALDYGWRKARLIHGDIEPDTILLSKKSEVKLAGLGFGHGLGEMRPFMAEGLPTGAAHYVSPERAEGKKDVDLRADIYSLGCTLFHLISGEPPYTGDTALAVILRHVTMPVPQLLAVRPECPEEISRVVMKMMHKLPSGRHQSYDDLIADLRLCYDAAANAPEGTPAPGAAPTPTPIPAPPKESIGVPLPKPTPSRESIHGPGRQPAPAVVAGVPQREETKAPPILPAAADASEKIQPDEKRRSLRKPLIIGGAALLAAIVALAIFGPWKKNEKLSEAQRAERDRATGKLAPIPKPSPVPKPALAKTTPAAPKLVPARTPPPMAPQLAGPAQRGITVEPIAVPPMREAALPEPTALKVPAVTAAPQSATGKWLAEQEPQWRAAFAGEVSGPFEKAVAELKAKHLATVEHELATLPPAEEKSAGVAFRAERARMIGGGTVPAEDESMAPPSLRAIRTTFRTAFAKLDTERLAKAKIVHARYDAVLAKTQAALTQNRREGEAWEIQSKREALRGEWLKPLAGSEPAVAEPPATAPEPVPQKPAPGPKLAKLAPRDLVQRLLAMGATISISRTGALMPIGKIADLPSERFAIAKVEFIPGEGMSAADLDIIEQLTDVEELQLTGVPAADATLKLLRSLPALRVLGLRDLKGITIAGFRSVASLPALKTLNVRGPVGAESLSAFVANRKLDSLSLNDVTFSEQDLGAIAGIPALKTLTIATREPITPAAWARLSGAKKLATLNVEKTPKSAAMIEQIGRIATLTSLSLGDVTLPDSDLAPLGALKLLGTLKTTVDSTVDGSVFAAWPPNLRMKTLTLLSKSSVSDKVLRGVATAFPMLDRLEVRADAASVTPAGIAHLQKLRHLSYVSFTGDGVDAAGLAHLATFSEITHLGIGAARLADTDVRLFAKFAALRELEWSTPPVTDTALKSFAKLHGLAQFKVGTAVKPENLEKLTAALPSTKVTP